jgi:hypothetical protein
MRITHEVLMKIANDFVTQRSKAERDITAVYLQGSLLREHPTINGTTDIDLFFLHAEPIREEREFVRITDEIHFDVSHQPVSLYRRPKELRSHPWLGPAIESCKILYDPQHFLDFTQASVRGQFTRPDHVLSRARPQVEHARQIWLDFNTEKPQGSPRDMVNYLQALRDAANAVASLSGPALTERRFLIDFPERAAVVKHTGLNAGLLGLLGAPQVDAPKLRSWLASWRAAYESASQNRLVPRLHPIRLNYYLNAMESMLAGERFQVALWPLWRTWTDMVAAFPEQTEHLPAWMAAGESLGMLDKAFQERITALDAFLDLIDETLETWARENGA